MEDRLAAYTTLGLGGPAARIERATSGQQLVELVRELDAAGEPLLLIAGGSNLVIADAGFDGTVVLVRNEGMRFEGEVVTAAAGSRWDALVAAAIERDLSGIEALSGIPGSVGATPIQNVGAYGQEVAETIRELRVLDRATGQIETLTGGDCHFGYRTSALKRRPERWVVLDVTFALKQSPSAQPLAYGQLADALGAQLGARPPLADVREAVLELRRSKGMVLDEDDPDARSAGSFFTNPFVDAATLRRIELVAGIDPPKWSDGERYKTSAAWLIEQAGFERGQGDPDGIAISSKHVLALTNRGSGTTAQLLALADEIAAAVRKRFGVRLEREPTLVI